MSRLTCIIVSALLFPVLTSAQESITFEKLSELLDPYFASELVSDIKAALPASSFDVWGFDVGDYSGDGFNDLIVSIRLRNDRKKEMKVYYFVDIDGILEVVREESANFIELPIEVGVTIGDGNAYILYKREENGWEVFGRRYFDGVVMLVDRYTTSQNVALIHEQYRNFQNLEGFDRFLRVRNEEVVFRSDFLTVPSYRRGRHISSGYGQTATASTSGYLLSGSYFRIDEKDLSLHVRSAWDPDFLYINIIVDDDQLVPHAEGNDSIGDRVEIWFDTYMAGDRFTIGSRRQEFRLASDTNIYGLTIDLGNFSTKQPSVSVSTTNLFDDDQSRATSRIRALASKRDSGWGLAIRIPFTFFGFRSIPVDDDRLIEMGSTIVVHDLDNPWRPEELTTIGTSQNFDRDKPATFGALELVPPKLHYGETVNIFQGQIKERLEEIGY